MRVLEVVTNLDGGGVDRLMYDYCSRIIPEIEFDFAVTTHTEGILEQPLKDLGCNIFYIPLHREGEIKRIKALREIIHNGNYDIVHAHGSYKSFTTVYAAMKENVKVRIVHSHIAFVPETRKERIVRLAMTAFAKKWSTHLFACGRDAGVWMWGKELYDRGKVYVVHNAVNTQRFKYSEMMRKQIRTELGISDDTFVIGNVARLSYQKNHKYLINVFSEIKKIHPKSLLLLVGRGELEGNVRMQVKQMDLEDSVIFLGIRNDVPNLLNAMDVFVLPSRFEGLPVVLVEVQANGLPCFASDTITDEIKIAPNVEYLSLDLSPEEWAERICSQNNNRIECDLAKAGYDIDTAAVELKNKYMSLCK